MPSRPTAERQMTLKEVPREIAEFVATMPPPGFRNASDPSGVMWQIPIVKEHLTRSMSMIYKLVTAFEKMVQMADKSNYHKQLDFDHLDSTIRLSRNHLDDALKRISNHPPTDPQSKHALRIAKAACGMLFAVDLNGPAHQALAVLKAWILVNHWLMGPLDNPMRVQGAIEDWRDFARKWKPL